VCSHQGRSGRTTNTRRCCPVIEQVRGPGHPGRPHPPRHPGREADHGPASDLDWLWLMRPPRRVADCCVPLAAWPSAQPGSAFAPPRGRGIPNGTPLTCWRPIQPGLTAHGLRHSHKTWMAEDGIPEILAEQRLGHQVPGMRGLYAHASTRDARLPQGRAPGPLGRLPPRPGRPQSALIGPAARRTAGTLSRRATAERPDDTSDPAKCTGTDGHGEDDLPNSSQTAGRPHPGTPGGACPARR
jgi:hypothetical protein